MTFTELLKQYGVSYVTEGHHHCRHGWIQLDCPFCGRGTQKWHMGYSLDNNFLNCWRCGFHPVIKTLVELTGLQDHIVRKMLDNVLTSPPSKIKTVKGKLKLPKNLEPLGKRHRNYLKSRNFDCSNLEMFWHLKGIGVSAKLPWRIFIPIHFQGQTESWTTRAIGNNSARYISASSDEERIPHKNLLYGEDYARKAIIICEGPTDVWRIGPGAVATLGVNYSPSQLNRMIQYPKRIICFDGDSGAQKRAQRLSDDLSVFAGETFIAQIDEKDPAEASDRTIQKLRKLLK